MNTATRVPAALKGQFDTLKLAADAFCDHCLNDEYKQLIGQALAALCRKRSSPLLRGPRQLMGCRCGARAGHSQLLV